MANQVYVPGSIPLGKDLIKAALDIRDVERLIVDQNPLYRTMSILLSQSGVQKRVAHKREYEMPYRGNITQTATIALRSLVNGILTLTWDDPSLDITRVDEVIESVSKTRVRCIWKIEGQAKFVFISTAVQGQTSIQATDFVLGEQVYYRGVQPDVNSPVLGTDRLMTLAQLKTNYVSSYMDTFAYTGEEGKTPSYIDGPDFMGTKVFIEQNEMDTINRVYEMYAANMYTGQKANQGGYWYQSGIDEQILVGNGVIKPYSGSLQESDVQAVTLAASSNGAFQNGEIWWVCNSRFKSQFQNNVTANYVLQAGNKNTFGGMEIEGIDVDTYDALGFKHKFMIDPQLNDPLKYNNLALGYGFSTMKVKTNKGVKAWAEEVYMSHPDIMVNRFGGIFKKDGSWNSNPDLRTKVSTVDVTLDKSFQLTNAQQCIKMFEI